MSNIDKLCQLEDDLIKLLDNISSVSLPAFNEIYLDFFNKFDDLEFYDFQISNGCVYFISPLSYDLNTNESCSEKSKISLNSYLNKFSDDFYIKKFGDNCSVRIKRGGEIIVTEISLKI